MSETLSLKPGKPAEAKPAETKPATAKPAQTLREAQPKKFAPSSLQESGQDYDILCIRVPNDWSFEDAMAPIAWTNVCGIVARDALNTRREKIGSLILLQAADESYMAWLRINAVIYDVMKNPCGLDLICVGPSIDLKTGKACPIDCRTGLPWTGRAQDKAAA